MVLKKSWAKLNFGRAKIVYLPDINFVQYGNN